MQQMPKHFLTSALNVTYDETEETNKKNDKNCRFLGKFSCNHRCGFFCVFRCDYLVRYFWNKSGKGVLDSIAIIENRHILRHSNQKIAHKNWIFFKYDLMRIWYLSAFFQDKTLKCTVSLCFGQANICYHLLNRQVVEKVNFYP